jgi:hypothetical protein
LCELSKLSRGFYTDTFSPFAYTHLLSFPVSAVHSDWPGYPETFDQSQWRAIVQHAVGPVVIVSYRLPGGSTPCRQQTLTP